MFNIKMNFKYLSWILAIVAFLTHIFGLINLLIFLIATVIFLLGFIIPIYSYGCNPVTWEDDLIKFIKNVKPNENPLENIKQLPPGQRLGLNLAGDKKPIILIQPNIKIQTESPKHSQKYQKQQHHGSTNSSESGHHKKSFLDSGIEMLFKKHGKVTCGIKETLHHHHMKENTILETASSSNGSSKSVQQDDKKWKPFETIKMYSERRSKSASQEKIDKENLQFGEDCASDGTDSSLAGSIPYNYTVTIESEAHLLDEHGSPKKKLKAMLSGNKKIDQLLHTIIDYVIRDFIDSWFCSLSDNKEFGDFRVRNCMEESINNLCTRMKNTQWIQIMTEKMVEKIASHTKSYRLAKQAIQTKNDNSSNEKYQHQRRNVKKGSSQQHKRNKSDTDLNRNYSTTSSSYNVNQKNVANSKFYVENPPDEKVLTDPEQNLLNEFFNQSNLYRKECMDEIELEKHLTKVTETILYFTIPEEDFACIPLRTFLSTLLANVVFKPFLKLISDPDFLNLQITKLIPKEQPPPVEYFLKALRQSNDLSELRACRQLIVKEMSAKYKDPTSSAEMNSLRYAQKLIDLRLSQLQTPNHLNVPDETDTGEEHSTYMKKLPILTLDELLFKELARSYFLDYLSDINLQKYVIFYLTADEWKCMAKHSIIEIQTNRNKIPKEEIYCNLKDKAQNIYQEYLQPPSNNCINIDSGLIEALSIKLKNPNIVPESGWFDSICKFVYEKLKNEEIFLTKFYQSISYKKLLLELEVDGISQNNDMDNFSEFSEGNLNVGVHIDGDNNSSDINFDDDMLDLVVSTKNPKPSLGISSNGNSSNFSILDVPRPPDLLDVVNFKHSRSHSDCGIPASHFESSDDSPDRILPRNLLSAEFDGFSSDKQERARSAPSQRLDIKAGTPPPQINLEGRQKLIARIINTAILCEGQYAVYAVEVTVIEDNQEKSWHIYRRYSKFLELKKILIKNFPNVAKLPFPAKKAFQNTQRSVLEHRMVLLNEFLRLLCQWSENNESLMKHMREFLEPDTDDRKIHGGAVVRTLEAVVNPLKSGMRTIKNMPDTLVGGFSRILLGKGPLREQSLLEMNLEQCEYPALNSMIHLIDEVFDLQARSQWLRRGIINRVLGAPWVSHTANKKIIHHAKSLIEIDKIEQILMAVLQSVWPDGKHQTRKPQREDNTKLRTRIAAQMSLFALLFDDLKRVVGSETTRHGLLNCFEMWQHEKLNLRLALILLNDALTEIYKVEDMTAHVYENES